MPYDKRFILLSDIFLMNKKYLSPTAYLRKARLIIVRFLLDRGIPLQVTTKVGQHLIRFSVTSFIEYFLRAEESYTREKVTMYWINEYIDSDDVIFDLGANVGAYSLLIGMKVALGNGRVYAFEPESSNFSSSDASSLLISDISNSLE